MATIKSAFLTVRLVALGYYIAYLKHLKARRLALPEIRLVDLQQLPGHPVRLTTHRENRALDRKRRRANRIIIRNRYACVVALATVIALRQRPAPASELKFLIANPDVPMSAARTAARDLGAWK
jgi:hypothetical protein